MNNEYIMMMLVHSVPHQQKADVTAKVMRSIAESQTFDNMYNIFIYSSNI